MTRYQMHFEWLNAVNVEDQACHDLEATTLEEAKMEAAILYATSDFRGPPPRGYRLTCQGEQAFRYP